MKVRVLSWALVLLLHGLLMTWLAGYFTGPSEIAQPLPVLAVDMVTSESQAEPQTATSPSSASPPPAPDTASPSIKSPEIAKKRPLAAKAPPRPAAPAPKAAPEEPVVSPLTASALPAEPQGSAAPAPTTASSSPGHATPASSVPLASTPVYIPADYAAGNRPPTYPTLSRRYKEEGTVVLRVLVRADGKAGQVEIDTSSGHALLDQAAQQAVQSWRFAPATRNGQAVSDWFLLPIRFTLHE